MKDLQRFISDINRQAREQGMENGLSAYYFGCGVDYADYSKMLERLDSEFDSYQRGNISAKRKRFLCYATDSAQILLKCGIDISKLKIVYVDGDVNIDGQDIKPPFTDTKTKTIYIPIEDGKINIKSLAHEVGHIKAPKKGQNSLNCECLAIEYELKLIKLLCQNDQSQYLSYRLDRIYSNLIKAELKRFLIETEDFSSMQQKLNELNAKYDLLNRWSITLNDIKPDLREFSYLFAIYSAD